MNLNFNEICRLCLRFCEKYVDLNHTNGVKTLSKELAEKIKFCYLVQLDLSDGLPTKVCYECIQVISFFYIAKKNVVISEQLLRDVLYVKKKLQDEAKMHKEKNITGSDSVKMKPEKQKTSRSLLIINGKPHNIINNVELNYTDYSQINNCSNVECKKDSSVSNNLTEVITTNFRPHSDFRVKKKKKFKYLQTHANQNKLGKLGKPLNLPNNTSDVSLKYMASKKLHGQHERNSKAVKVNKAEKEASKTDTPLEEYVFREIGTVIDTSNILSPDVKRTRKSVLARYS